jgi:hypothetical protein
MNIQGLDKAQVLIALYNRARVQGLGFLNATNQPMTESEAEILLSDYRGYFDYLYGKVMKINLAGDEVDTRLYNRDNGEGAAERAVDILRK